MSKKDEIKARINIFQAIIILLITTLFAIFGYTAIHYKEYDLILVVCTVLACAFLVIMICICVKYFLKLCKKIKDAKMIGVVAVVFAFIAFFGSLLYVAYTVGRD